mmetsp:Transcript_120815/g.221274  ORF Transcript_120815/g.221274 Transcript_120815/m.221274 type:complete len:116 (+) Transcript_120815:246-593(+)
MGRATGFGNGSRGEGLCPKGRGERILDGGNMCCNMCCRLSGDEATAALGSTALGGEVGVGLASSEGRGETILDGACRDEAAPAVGSTMLDGGLGRGLNRLCRCGFGGACGCCCGA